MKRMIQNIPFVQRSERISIRGGYSTALSTRYEAWSGLHEKNHGQHTMVLIEYD